MSGNTAQHGGEGPIEEVTCARCGQVGSSNEFHVVEHEWECPTCWKWCEAEERASRNLPE